MSQIVSPEEVRRFLQEKLGLKWSLKLLGKNSLRYINSKQILFVPIKNKKQKDLSFVIVSVTDRKRTEK